MLESLNSLSHTRKGQRVVRPFFKGYTKNMPSPKCYYWRGQFSHICFELEYIQFKYCKTSGNQISFNKVRYEISKSSYLISREILSWHISLFYFMYIIEFLISAKHERFKNVLYALDMGDKFHTCLQIPILALGHILPHCAVDFYTRLIFYLLQKRLYHGLQDI
jgi:hypothetical protein